MAHVHGEPSAKSVKRLSLRLNPVTIDELMMLIENDHAGRPPLPAGLPRKALLIKEIAQSLNLNKEAVKPLVMGRHLIEWGLTPGPKFGKLLKVLFDLQLDGDINSVEDAKKWWEDLVESLREQP